MKRRTFISLLGAASLAPALPNIGTPAPVAAATGYNRYMYGLGVFHARTRAGVTTADLMTRLKITAPQASAMMHEMTARGALASISSTAVSKSIPRAPYVRKALRQLAETALADAPDKPETAQVEAQA